VERHLQNAYRKVGVRNRADAAAYITRTKVLIRGWAYTVICIVLSRTMMVDLQDVRGSGPLIQKS
jgi:hypothetical protein